MEYHLNRTSFLISQVKREFLPNKLSNFSFVLSFSNFASFIFLLILLAIAFIFARSCRLTLSESSNFSASQLIGHQLTRFFFPQKQESDPLEFRFGSLDFPFRTWRKIYYSSIIFSIQSLGTALESYMNSAAESLLLEFPIRAMCMQIGPIEYMMQIIEHYKYGTCSTKTLFSSRSVNSRAKRKTFKLILNSKSIDETNPEQNKCIHVCLLSMSPNKQFRCCNKSRT